MSAMCLAFKPWPPNLQRLRAFLRVVKSDRTRQSTTRRARRHVRLPACPHAQHCDLMLRGNDRTCHQSGIWSLLENSSSTLLVTWRCPVFGPSLVACQSQKLLASTYVSMTGLTLLCVRSLPNSSVWSHTETMPLTVEMTRRTGLGLGPASNHSSGLLDFTNNATLNQMCQPPSVSPCAHVLAYFHKHFQGC
jgi:hypothetical protein